MTQRYLVLFILMLGCSFGFSQNEDRIRNLKHDLVRAQDPGQYKLLNDLAWEYRAAYPDSAIYFALKAYKLGQKLKERNHLATPLNFAGLAYFHRGDHLDAFDYFNQALKVAEDQNDSLQLAHAYNNVGRLFLEQGLLSRSFDYLTKASSIFNTINDSSGMAYSFQSLASYYKIKKDIPKAEDNYKKAYRIRLSLGDTREIMSAMIQLGKLYMDNQSNEKALHYLHLADSAGNVINDAINLAEVKTLMALCMMNAGSLKEAENMAMEGLQYIKGSQNVRLLPGAYLTMGQILFKKGDLYKAKEYFTRAVEISTQRKDLNTRMEAYFFLWQTFKQQKMIPEELKHYTQYIVLKDSIESQEAMQQEERLRFQMEIEKREQEYKILKANEERKTAVILFLIVIIILSSFMLYMQLRNRKRILHINHLLGERNHEIKKINNVLHSKNDTLENHMTTLLGFSKNRNIAVGNLHQATRDIACITAKNLKVSQVSIWVYDDDHKCIESLACYNLHQNAYLDTMKLGFDTAPNYFDALKKERIIMAEDARTHMYTHEFTETYFITNNIYSLLDATFFLDGHLKGLLCCEQQHEIKQWTTEDQIFASSVADIISLAFRTSQRLEFERHIKQQNKEIAHMNEELEERVRQRTEELQKKNESLSEYAFINSHLLRGPLSRILGLINLIEHDKTMKEGEIINLLRQSGNELDAVVKKITDALNDGNDLTRGGIQ